MSSACTAASWLSQTLNRYPFRIPTTMSFSLAAVSRFSIVTSHPGGVPAERTVYVRGVHRRGDEKPSEIPGDTAVGRGRVGAQVAGLDAGGEMFAEGGMAVPDPPEGV